ncbi:MAG: hypothetical protein KBC17_00130 [Candidatus Pacebacteria bacterium]|nr:hypothetical protein [Candidatus Paceibacterota bacterium]
MCDFNKPSFTINSDKGKVKLVHYHQEEHQLFGLAILEDEISIRQFEGKISDKRIELFIQASMYDSDNNGQTCTLYEFPGEAWKEGAITEGTFVRSEKSSSRNKTACKLTTHATNLVPYQE